MAGGIIKDMSSKDEAKSRVAMLRAEELLGDGEKTWDECSLKTVVNGTKINHKAFEDLGKPKEEIPSDAGMSNLTLTIHFYLHDHRRRATRTLCFVAGLNFYGIGDHKHDK